MYKLFNRLVFLLFPLVCLVACSSVAPEVKQRFLFPPPPSEARIEYLQGFFSDHDLKSAQKDFFTKYVLGETRPIPLFKSPVDVAATGKGLVYVADSGFRQVVVLDLVQGKSRILAPPATSDGRQRDFGMPFGLSIAADGKIYVCDLVNKSVDVFDENERYLFSLGDPEMLRPTAVAVDVVHEIIYVLDTSRHRLALFDLQGNLIGYRGERGGEPGQFNFPTDVDVDEQGHLYVLDTLNARVQVFDEKGAFLRMFGERGTAEGSFEIPKCLSVSSYGHVYVTDALAHKLVVFSTEGQLLLRIGSKSVVKQSISPGGFYLPRGVDADPAGGIWVVDSLNRMVHNFQYLTPQYLAENPLD